MTRNVATTEDRLAGLIADLQEYVPHLELQQSGSGTATYRSDRSRRAGLTEIDETGPWVALPSDVAQVQDVVRLAARHQISIVPRGAGTGLSGGAVAELDQLVLSTERLNRVVEISPLDQIAIVEPGVITAQLNPLLREHGLFYAPDPASFEISSIGGNIATNAGGLHCAKYGVTGDSVLALDVVLSDGSLIHVGHRSIKGVAGLDLTSLFIGSEGILGIVVAATLRLRKLPIARQTITAFFPSTEQGLIGLEAITRSPVDPAVVEFFDTPTLKNVDEHSGTHLLSEGSALILIELDGYGLDDQVRHITSSLNEAGGEVIPRSEGEAEVFWQLRRGGRGFSEDYWAIGEDIAVPKSQLRAVYASFAPIEEKYAVEISAIAHAGDGNLHPLIKRKKDLSSPQVLVPRELTEAADALVQRALELGGTVSGEHGIGTAKLKWLTWEISERNHELQSQIRQAIDPQQLLNPGKGI